MVHSRHEVMYLPGLWSEPEDVVQIRFGLNIITRIDHHLRPLNKGVRVMRILGESLSKDVCRICLLSNRTEGYNQPCARDPVVRISLEEAFKLRYCLLTAAL